MGPIAIGLRLWGRLLKSTSYENRFNENVNCFTHGYLRLGSGFPQVI